MGFSLTEFGVIKKPYVPSKKPIHYWANYSLKIFLLNEAPTIMRNILGLNTCAFCLSISYIISEVLKVFGIHNELKKARIAFGTPKAVEVFKNEKDLKKISEIYIGSDGFYTVGLGFEQNNLETLFPLHSIIQFEDGSLLDMTASQADRPQKGLHIHNYWVMPDDLPKTVISYETAQIFDFHLKNAMINQISPEIIAQLVIIYNLKISQCLGVVPKKIQIKYKNQVIII